MKRWEAVFFSFAAESLNLLPVVGECLHSFPTSEAEYRDTFHPPLQAGIAYSKFCQSDTSSQGFELGWRMTNSTDSILVRSGRNSFGITSSGSGQGSMAVVSEE